MVEQEVSGLWPHWMLGLCGACCQMTKENSFSLSVYTSSTPKGSFMIGLHHSRSWKRSQVFCLFACFYSGTMSKKRNIIKSTNRFKIRSDIKRVRSGLPWCSISANVIRDFASESSRTTSDCLHCQFCNEQAAVRICIKYK